MLQKNYHGWANYYLQSLVLVSVATVTSSPAAHLTLLNLIAKIRPSRRDFKLCLWVETGRLLISFPYYPTQQAGIWPCCILQIYKLNSKAMALLSGSETQMKWIHLTVQLFCVFCVVSSSCGWMYLTTTHVANFYHNRPIFIFHLWKMVEKNMEVMQNW